ncbi:glycosyltransferase family 2 protein [Arthrobacter sp. NQ4]|uniref:glycosyltransferase family 2 protein n=1 Tax=Arthrobacter sp. NQ4 TaxID=3027930 RepID=UPI0023AE924B|nr:cellulose synthase catalytic subunit [Arthrobacter sp. NQ4]MDE8585876.1 cellulose synthase catalytic subunit [Arthrobacter sp. NQ4]
MFFDVQRLRPGGPPALGNAADSPTIVPSRTGLAWLMPPRDGEKYSYLRTPQHRWVFWLSALAMAGFAVSFVGLATQSYWTLVFLLPLVLLVTEQCLSLRTSTNRRRISMADHAATVELWEPTQVPSVDVFIPTCGEDLEVLANTAHHVRNLQWPGVLRVHVLDDAGREEVRELAVGSGFGYVARPGNAFKKAGNLQHAFERTSGDHVVIFDADFVPRPDFLLELVPYLDDPTVGIVQSPQHFYTHKSMSWLERCAGATQEMFYRFIQPSRDAVGAAICVGTSAVYRRQALMAIGGFPQIGHSEDVYTGLHMKEQGYQLKYVPVLLSRGQCPTDIDSFISQQYRWCEGSMSLVAADSFHDTPSLTLPQRMSFWSGFLYYMSTAMLALLAPIPLIVMAFFFPANITPLNSLPLLGAIVLWLIALPVVSLGRWRLDVLRVQAIYGFAHLFCIADMFRGLVSEWVPTGSASAQIPVARRVRSFMGPYILATQALTLVGLCLGVNQYGIEQFWAAIVLFALSSYVFVPVGILAMGRGIFSAAKPAAVAIVESA